MSKLRKNNSAISIRGNNLYNSDENDIKYYLLNRTINKAIATKLKQSYTKGYIDLSKIGLDSIPDKIFKINYSIDGVKWWKDVDFTKIDLSYNKLNENNCQGFRNIPHVKILYLANNRFNEISIFICYLKNLIILDMSNNRLSYIDDNFCWNLTNLKTLDLSGNLIKSIPPSIRYMRYLRELNLSKNEILNIPYELTYLKHLKILDVSWNKIQLIKPNIFNELYSLEELYCNNNLLTNINNINNYTVFDSIISLKILDISNNQFQDFIEFHQIPDLEKINISYNKLKNVFGLNLCENLYEINCSNNLFKELPYEFLSIKNLSKLNIKFNLLNNIPTLICLMDNLTELNIEGNPMKEAPNLKYSTTFQIKKYLRFKLSEKDIYFSPEDLKQNYYRKINYTNNNNIFIDKYPYIHSSIFKYIKNNTELVIRNADLREIPFDMIKYYIPENFLTSIDLSGNLIEKGLEYFRNIIFLLKNVKSLNFSKNNIKYFPIILLNLPYLEELYLSRNLLSVFPAKNITQNNYTNITQFLLILDLSNNLLNEFPVIIEFFKKLRFLNLSSNNINNMDCLQYMRLENLEKFFIDNNKIYEIPQNVLFRAIPNVQTFTISNNYLTEIPTDLFLLIFLENINFFGNYISKIPFEYLLNAVALKHYLKKYHVYSDEQIYFELKQEEKLRNNYYAFKEKERLNKTSPIYRSRRNINYLNYKYNKSNDNKILWSSTNYHNNNIFNNNSNNEFVLNKYINESYDASQFKRNLAEINSDIYEIESIMKTERLQPHVKANLKKKFINLIMERADLYK